MAKRVRRVKRTRGKSRLKTAAEIAELQRINELGDVGDSERDPDAHRELRVQGAGGASGGELDLGHDESGISAGRGAPEPLGLDAVNRVGEVPDAFGIDEGRSAYDSIVRSHLAEDAARFAALREKGETDVFNPDLSPLEVEQKGQIAAANHIVRLYDHWMLEGADRDATIEKAAEWLGQFQRPDLIRKVITELESKPIRDVYPLEVMLELLETAPHKLPGVQFGPLIANAESLEMGEKVYVGHEVQVPIPEDVRLKGFALLGGHRAGYEFYPGDKNGTYTLIVDTPGEWDFAVYGVKTQKLGKMMRELPGGVVHKFTVKVGNMGRKPEPAPVA